MLKILLARSSKREFEGTRYGFQTQEVVRRAKIEAEEIVSFRAIFLLRQDRLE